ncbi:permease [Bacillus sp. V2I10]|uniref:permease n=1 Tax=Bacillus sp. V2I10 TaxID=3042276 RepID=UPI00277E5010|nr:permease [Bacillus sp. V2I10]MDQ0859918.1 uncharacterized membrane protein YraQ (UPF0718 family) [Bacillus sp. V2I10]
MSVSSRMKDLFLYTLFLFLIYLFFLGNENMLTSLPFSFDEEAKSIFIAFLTILVEALPFIILGAFFSSVIQLFVSEQMILRSIPKNPLASIIASVCIAALTPICECAIIPVVRRLIHKGVPVHAGAVLLTGAPILNITVFTSTYYAFPNQPEIYLGRLFLCLITALITGWVMYLIFFRSNVLRVKKDDFISTKKINENKKGQSKWKAIIHHTSHEFFQVGKYFIIGAFLASLAQYYLADSKVFNGVANPLAETGFMMGLAFLMSICSEADAFIAASFSNLVRPEAILGFLVFGPIMDLKNFLAMFACFRLRFIFFYIITVTVSIFVLSISFAIFFMEG